MKRIEKVLVRKTERVGNFKGYLECRSAFRWHEGKTERHHGTGKKRFGPETERKPEVGPLRNPNNERR
jgi:hypothetical protein